MFLKEFFEKANFEKKSAYKKSKIKFMVGLKFSIHTYSIKQFSATSIFQKNILDFSIHTETVELDDTVMIQ